MNGRSVFVPEKPLLDGNSLPKEGKEGSALSHFSLSHSIAKLGVGLLLSVLSLLILAFSLSFSFQFIESHFYMIVQWFETCNSPYKHLHNAHINTGLKRHSQSSQFLPHTQALAHMHRRTEKTKGRKTKAYF